MTSRRSFWRAGLAVMGIGVGLASMPATAAPASGSVSKSPDRPHIVLVMSDDQGWGDVAYNGNTIAQTPHLDAFAADGIRLDRFYAAAPVCSPTRASCLTGRHPFRVGVPWAGDGHLPADEQTLAEVLRAAGYATGHFGKWHVGELSKTVNQSYFAGDLARPEAYSPPWENGFDASFATESMMPTYNPYYHVGGDYGAEDYRFLQKGPVKSGQRVGGFRWRDHYWTGPGQMVDEWLEGDDSEIIMDRALDFFDRQLATGKPIFMQVWFHAVHTPVVAGDEDRAAYADQSMQAQHWFGSLSAMDRQVGRLRAHLRAQGIAGNTIVWFCSDNGPSYIHDFNSAGPLRGKKAELLEGGVRVPGLVEWPAKLQGGRAIGQPMSTSDFYPTLLAAAGVALPDRQPELDGINVLPLLTGKVAERTAPIGFVSPKRGGKYDADPGTRQYAWHEGPWKLYSKGGETWELYDVVADRGESRNLAAEQLARVAAMKKALMEWVGRVNADAARLGKAADAVGALIPPVDLLISETTEVTGVPDAADRYHQFREPCLVVTNKGRLVMVAQGRDQSAWSDRSGQDLVATWSDDGGRTWSKPVLAVEHGNQSICPNALVYDRDEDALHALYNLFLWDYHGGRKAMKAHEGPQCWQYQITSRDGGATWSEPREITKMFGEAGPIVVFGSGRGIQLRHGKHVGRLIVPGSDRHGAWTNAAIFSDDHGKTWKEGGSADRKVSGRKLNIRGECKIAELEGEDGRGMLVMNARCSPLRVQATSTDGGDSFGRFELLESMPAASCNGALISATLKDGREALLACMPVGVAEVPRMEWNAVQARSRGMVYLSFDAGRTWPHRRAIVLGTFAYVSMAQLNDGTIGVAYETELHVHGSYKHIRFTRFSLDWLLVACDPMPEGGSGIDPHDTIHENPGEGSRP